MYDTGVVEVKDSIDSIGVVAPTTGAVGLKVGVGLARRCFPAT